MYISVLITKLMSHCQENGNKACKQPVIPSHLCLQTSRARERERSVLVLTLPQCVGAEYNACQIFLLQDPTTDLLYPCCTMRDPIPLPAPESFGYSNQMYWLVQVWVRGLDLWWWSTGELALVSGLMQRDPVCAVDWPCTLWWREWSHCLITRERNCMRVFT